MTDIKEENTIDENQNDDSVAADQPEVKADETMEEFVEEVEEAAEEATEEAGETDETPAEEEATETEDTPEETPEERTDFSPQADDDGVVVIGETVQDDAKWYVVHTYAGHEKKVAITLKQRAESGGYTDRVYKVFIPHQQKIVISEGKKRSVDERLFPGYVIVQMSMSDDAWLLVRSTRGVTGFVGMGSTPTPLPSKEVKALMKFAKMEAPKFEAKFSVGDSVKIMEGPFRDFLGKVDEVNDDQGKVKVLVSVFGRETPVELDFVQVQNI